jgi:hypothetical protein
MNENLSSLPTDPVDELATQLLECGGILSQIISHMVAYQEGLPSGQHEVPIPETAHALIRDVLGSVRKSHSKRDIKVAAAIVRQAADVISEEVFFVEPEPSPMDRPSDSGPLALVPDLAEPEDSVSAFTLELLRTGHMLSNLGADLVDSLPEDEYPGESPAAVVVEMVIGTIRTTLADADEDDLMRATELMACARDRVLEHLQLALALSRRMDGDAEDEPRRGYG